MCNVGVTDRKNKFIKKKKTSHKTKIQYLIQYVIMHTKVMHNNLLENENNEFKYTI